MIQQAYSGDQRLTAVGMGIQNYHGNRYCAVKLLIAEYQAALRLQCAFPSFWVMAALPDVHHQYS